MKNTLMGGSRSGFNLYNQILKILVFVAQCNYISNIFSFVNNFDQ